MNDQPKKKKVIHQSKSNLDGANAWKSACFVCRTALCVASGRVIGDWKVDDALGTAFAEMYPPKDLARQGTAWAIGVSALNGAWDAIRRP